MTKPVTSAAMARQPRVLLTDTARAPFVARLAISLSRSGAVVSALCPYRSPASKTRALHRVFHYSAVRPLSSLAHAIGQETPDVVVPCDDRALQHLYEIDTCARASVKWGKSMVDLIENSLGSPESYPTLFSRDEFLQVAREEGIPVPESRVIETLKDFKAWQSCQRLPWVLKADVTFGGRGVRIATNVAEADQYFSELREMYSAKRAIKRMCVNRDSFWVRPWLNRVKPIISVQSYIPGTPANCAVFCWKGKVLAQTNVHVIKCNGTTGPASIVRVVDGPGMTLAAERIAHRLKLSGFFGLDFMVHAETGVPYVIEINPRATPLCHLQLGKNSDLIEALYAQISGQPARQIPPVTLKDVIGYFPQACNDQSELPESAYLDIPHGEPDLVQELLNPWPERGLVWRFACKVDQIRGVLTGALFNRAKKPTKPPAANPEFSFKSLEKKNP
jgi:hypothetical protein